MALGKTNFQTPNDPNLIASNIKNGVSILGVVGTYSATPGTLQSLVYDSNITVYYYRVGNVIILSYGTFLTTNIGFFAQYSGGSPNCVTASDLITKFNSALGLSLSSYLLSTTITATFIWILSDGSEHSGSTSYPVINILY